MLQQVAEQTAHQFDQAVFAKTKKTEKYEKKKLAKKFVGLHDTDTKWMNECYVTYN